MSCAESATKWYKSNFLKGNLNKYRTMTLENKNNPMENIVIDGYEVPSTDCLNLLWVLLDCKLQFTEQINIICVN
jgi:hypothetical protein